MKLSLCMIVKNESRWIKQSLSSVKDLVDEIVIVDTGSTDDTVEIAKEYGAIVYNFAWQNDFSKARNASIAHAKGDWILVLDADEALSPDDHAIIRSIIGHSDKRLVSLIQTTYCNDSATFGWIPNKLRSSESDGYPGYLESRLTRLFKNAPDIRFEGVIHEHANGCDGEVPIDSNVRIHHYGKYTSEDLKLQKDQLYLKLGEEKCRLEPDNFHAWYELAVQLWGMNHIDQSLEAITKSLQINPTHVRSHVAMAALSAMQKNATLAIKHYTRVMELEPSNMMPYLQLPPILSEMKMYKQALEVIDLGASIAGHQPSFHINRGIVLQSMDDHDEAIHAFDEALLLNPDESLAQLNKGISYMMLNDGLKALESFVKIKGTAEYGYIARKKMAELSFRTGCLDESLAQILVLIEENPSDMELKYQKGVIALKQGRLSDAREALAEIHDLAGFDSQALKNIQQCHLALGNLKEAEIISKKLQQQDDQHPNERGSYGTGI